MVAVDPAVTTTDDADLTALVPRASRLCLPHGQKEAAIRRPVETLLVDSANLLGLRAVLHAEVAIAAHRIRPDLAVRIGKPPRNIVGYVELRAESARPPSVGRRLEAPELDLHQRPDMEPRPSLHATLLDTSKREEPPPCCLTAVSRLSHETAKISRPGGLVTR
ncbi:hypothetical protein ABT404_00180 [Streptomyces hyaluromycini]|uniref:Uncharacterized protein n=1 Tax=Streptomyces hyaluromycini TaxID=1377993 RepID=A0ABV1WM28_9ACTN